MLWAVTHPPTPFRRAALAAAVVALALPAQACARAATDASASGATSGTEPTLAGSPTAILRPVPESEPQMPATVAEKSLQGAADTVFFWLDAVNWGLSTGDSGPVGPVTGANCLGCQDFVIEINNAWLNGGRIEDGYLQMNGLAALPEGSTETTEVFQTFAYRVPGVSVDADGQETPVPANAGVLNITTEWVPAGSSGRWLVKDIASAPEATPTTQSPGVP